MGISGIPMKLGEVVVLGASMTSETVTSEAATSEIIKMPKSNNDIRTQGLKGSKYKSTKIEDARIKPPHVQTTPRAPEGRADRSEAEVLRVLYI